MPAGLDTVKEIVAGDTYSLAITTADTAVAWGSYTLNDIPTKYWNLDQVALDWSYRPKSYRTKW